MLTETVSQYFEGSIRNNWDFKGRIQVTNATFG